MSPRDASPVDGLRVLITGGLGFIGSALARSLVDRGARVRVLDSLLPQSGGSPLNVAGFADRLEIVIEDTRSRDVVDRVVDGCDVIYHFAGQSGPKAFGADFYSDVDIACLGALNVLEAVRARASNARLVFASSHHVYGATESLPVPETAPTEPCTIFGVHKLTGEKYCGVHRGSVDAIVARLTTIVGPRQRLQGSMSGTVAHVLESALHGEDVNLRGHADEVHDILFVDDAVTALTALATSPSDQYQVLNVGSGRGTTMREIATVIVQACGRGTIRDEGAAGDPLASGFVADVRRLRSLGVPEPTRSTADALRETVRWFRGSSSTGDAA